MYEFVGNDGVDRWDVLGWGTPEEADQYMRGEQDILDRKPSCCKRKVTIDITFVELNEADDARDYTNWSFLASIWGGVMGMLPGHQSIIQPDYNNRFIDQDQRTTDLLRSDIESKLRPDDCIDEIIIRAHGNSEQVGGLLAQQIAVPGAPQHGLFEWLRTRAKITWTNQLRLLN